MTKPASEIIGKLRRKIAKLDGKSPAKLLSQALAEIKRLEALVQILSKGV